LPPLPSGNPTIRLVSLGTGQTAYYLVTGDASVLADTTNSMKVSAGTYNSPCLIGINPSASHISIFVEGTAGKVTMTPGSLSGDLNAGNNVAMNWKGVWSSLTTYAVDDLVSYNGSSYIAVNANTNSAPPSANWSIVADKGAVGSPNSLAIGSVTSGATANATITGTAPAQTLNLVLPKGAKGDTGPAGTISVGSTETVPAGNPANVVNTGTSTAAILNFSIPLAPTEFVLTRAALNALMAGGDIEPGRTYLISDEAHFAFGLTTTTVYDPPKLSTGSSPPSSPRVGDWWLDTN
jgi:hypothetical protein